MAIVFPRESHQYVYGQPVKIVTDHMLLESLTRNILIKSFPGLSERFLNLREIHSTFYTILAPKIPVPDTLSRAFLQHESIDEDLLSYMKVLVHSLVRNLDLTATNTV